MIDKDFNIVKDNIKLKKYGSIKDDDTPCQCHDSLVINENHYFLQGIVSCTMHNHPNFEKVNVLNCIIQEIENNEVVWQFESVDYPELYLYGLTKNDFESGRYDNFYADYAHMNSMQLTSDMRYIYIGFRNIGIIKFDRLENKIIWHLGQKHSDIDLKNFINVKDLFRYQHDIRLLDDNTFTIFDNNNESIIKDGKYENDIDKSKNSRVMKFNIIDKELKNFYCSNTGKVPSQSMGGCINIKNNIYDVTFGQKYIIGIMNEINFDTKETNCKFKFIMPKLLYRIERTYD